MEHAEILHRCFRCGYCKLPGSYQDLNCPSYLKFRFETYSPGGRMWLLRAWLEGEIETSPRLAEIFFSCAACGNCVEHCVFPEFKADLLNAFTAGREELVEQGTLPGTVAEYLKRIQLYGNPYGLPEADRGLWADGLSIQPYSGQEYLFYVGCPGSYDERGRRMARAVARLLKKWDVDFGILGEHERCDGNEVRVLGESGLFEQLTRKNIEQFEKAGVRKILTLSPHGFHAMKNEYPRFGGEFKVVHYSQLIADLIKQGKLKLDQGLGAKLTYHDPCYLGRYNGVYQEPRRILQVVPEADLKEMERSKKKSLCCGGGVGLMWIEEQPGTTKVNHLRVEDVLQTGADTVVTACPYCLQMFEESIEHKEIKDSLKAKDLAEIVDAAMKQS